jgi:hypothetical protein
MDRSTLLSMRDRMDICHPTDQTGLCGSGCPLPRIPKGSVRRMTAIGRPCPVFPVARKCGTEEPRRRQASKVVIHTWKAGCPDDQGENTGPDTRSDRVPRTSIQVALDIRAGNSPTTWISPRKVLASRVGLPRPFHKGSRGNTRSVDHTSSPKPGCPDPEEQWFRMGVWYPPGGSRVWDTGEPVYQAQGLPGRRELLP